MSYGVEPATDKQVELMKQFWEDTPEHPPQRVLNARLLKKDFLSLIARIKTPCETCRRLLSEGLDLCVRARDMDAMDRRAAALAASTDGGAWQESGKFDQYIERHNASPEFYHQPISTKSATMPLWFKDQYERDLADWENKARAALSALKEEDAR